MIKKLFIGAFAALSMMSCGSKDKQVESVVDKQTTMDEVIMSRRSIRKWQDKTISRDTLDIIMKHGINAPNGKGIQAYEVRVIDKLELLKEMSEAVVKDMPNVGEREGFKNIFVDAPCVDECVVLECELCGISILHVVREFLVATNTNERIVLKCPSVLCYILVLAFVTPNTPWVVLSSIAVETHFCCSIVSVDCRVLDVDVLDYASTILLHVDDSLTALVLNLNDCVVDVESTESPSSSWTDERVISYNCRVLDSDLLSLIALPRSVSILH